MARTHVVLDDEVLAAIDGAVGQRGRSRFLEEAAREKLARLALEDALRSTAGIVRSGRYPQWRDRESTARWVRAPGRAGGLSRYLLDTTVLVSHLRGDEDTTALLLRLLTEGHSLETTAVNIAEVVRGLRPAERRRAKALLDRLGFLPTTREAAERAGRYQADFARRGITIPTPDTLIAGTARAFGAVVLTDNVADFPMGDVRVVRPPPA